MREATTNARVCVSEEAGDDGATAWEVSVVDDLGEVAFVASRGTKEEAWARAQRRADAEHMPAWLYVGGQVVEIYRPTKDVLSGAEMAALGVTEAALAGLRAEAEENDDDELLRLVETAVFGDRWAVEQCSERLRA